MRLVVHIWRLVGASVKFGRAPGRRIVPLLIPIGLVLGALVLLVQTSLPFVLYPFA